MLQKWSTWRVFDIFAACPQKNYQLREISRKVKLAPTAVKLHLKDLLKDDFILKEKKGTYSSYRANFDSEQFRFYKKIRNIAILHESGLLKKLAQATPDAIVLFGSYSKGEDIETSDIDLCVLAKERELDLKEYEKKLGRKIQLFFAENINTFPAELQNNIMNGIVLSGFIRWKI